jgi:hypothetical protein
LNEGVNSDKTVLVLLEGVHDLLHVFIVHVFQVVAVAKGFEVGGGEALLGFDLDLAFYHFDCSFQHEAFPLKLFVDPLEKVRFYFSLRDHVANFLSPHLKVDILRLPQLAVIDT